MTVMIPILLPAMAARWMWGRAMKRRADRRDATEDALRDMFQAEDGRRLVHGKTVAEILAEDSEASDQLRRDLEWATEEYLTAEWLAIRRRFQQDVRFRFMVWARIRLCRFTRQT
jgi:hypothetical protein